MINGEYALSRADQLADRLLAASFKDTASLITFVVRLTWGRDPQPADAARCVTFLSATMQDSPAKLSRLLLTDLCHILFNANEFLYLE